MFDGLLLLLCNTVLITHSWGSWTNSLRFRQASTPERFLQLTLSTPRAVQPATSQRRNVERVSHKQNDVVNMLWRRTNVFIDEVDTTPKYQTSNKLTEAPQRSIHTISAENNNIDFNSIPLHNFLTVQRPFPQFPTTSSSEFYYPFGATENERPSDIVMQSQQHMQHGSNFQTFGYNSTGFKNTAPQNPRKVTNKGMLLINERIVKRREKYSIDEANSLWAFNGVVQPIQRKQNVHENARNPKMLIQRRSLQNFRNETSMNTSLPQNSTNKVIHTNNEEMAQRNNITYLKLPYLKTTSKNITTSKTSSTTTSTTLTSTQAYTKDISESSTLNAEDVSRCVLCKHKCKEYYKDDEMCSATKGLRYSLTPETKSSFTTGASQDDVDITLNSLSTAASMDDNIGSSSSRTFNDKVKFFEVYDFNTESYNDEFNNSRMEYEFEHVDSDLDDMNAHKVIIRNKRIGNSDKFNNSEELIRSRVFTVTSAVTDTTSYKTITNQTTIDQTSESAYFNNFQNAAPTSTTLPKVIANKSKIVSWAQYPFMAVYVYEHFQVYCDAGVISAHWLLAAGSCLSRRREDLPGDGRSAFVSYCGDSWWALKGINYVKYTLIHPQFSTSDRVRKHLYNVGVIKVANSLASTCVNWTPVPLISHQYYISDRNGAMASAIGWGLDRYDTEYSFKDLPRRRLSVYNGLTFSNICPGSKGYSEAKYRGEEGIQNVYCLTLPHYGDEENDPTHGSLLMFDGKLVALFLQEERKRWGDQSAQYTGIWKAMPWIMKFVKEPEDTEFTLEND